jgi:alpha-galactosidase
MDQRGHLAELSDGRLRWSPPGITVEFLVDPSAPIRIASFHPDAAAHRRDAPAEVDSGPLVELNCLGEGRAGDTSAGQHRPYAAAAALRHTHHEELADARVPTLALHQRDGSRGIAVRTLLEAWPGTGVMRARNEVTNTGAGQLVLTYVSSLALGPFGGGLQESTLIHQARNTWVAELRWQAMTPYQAGLVGVRPLREGRGTTRGAYGVTNAGSWSSGDYLPMGAIENLADGLTWAWQIEHQGAWHWQVGDRYEDLYLLVSGPTDREHHWRQVLQPGQTFRTVPVAVAVSAGDLTAALCCLTDYRRAMRRPSRDNVTLPVIFNDYMNCLMGDPSESRLGPLITAAAEVGSEYFVIDAGWYSDEPGWWDTVGAWEASTRRFPSGLEKTLQRIRDEGMIPGLWLEPEVVGVRSPAARELPDDAFFTRFGRRITEFGRFQLDYRSPAVRRRMDAVIDRLVGDWGVGYLKLDYNINIAPGTDGREESPGAGLLGHNLAYLSWLDGVLDRHPDLVLEDCSSGGMRMDYALLARQSILSTSDQRDHISYAAIAAAAPSAVTPEQGAVWAYPQPEHSPEEATFCLVNAMLGRIHLSGRVDLMSREQRTRVRQAVRTYQGYRSVLATARPYWPLGLPGWYDEHLALALLGADEGLLAVWWRGAQPTSIDLPLPTLGGAGWSIEPIFPLDLSIDLDWSDEERRLRVALPAGPAARLLRARRA